MKISKLVVISAAVLGFAVTGWASDLNFILINKTGADFEALYISPGKAEKWDNNLLGKGGVIENGKGLSVKFEANEDDKIWDIKVVDKEGAAITFEDIDLTGKSKVTLIVDGDEVTAEVD